MHFQHGGRALRSASLFTGIFLSTQAVAQGTVAADSATANDKSGKVIEEVYVSATKRDSALQDTGIAISVLTADEMKFRDMNNLEDFENSVPGLKVGTVLGTPLINIRGVGLNFITGLGNPGVATHYDGVYMPRANSTALATVDIAQVEVLRGPQGTLYGRNATGGSVNFLSKRPGSEFGAGATVGMGDYDREFYEGYIEGPVISDRLAARLFLRKDEFSGYGKNETNGKDIGGIDAVMGHFTLTYQVTDSLEIHAGYTRRDDDMVGAYSTPLTTVTPILGTAGMEYPTSEQSFKPRNTKGIMDPTTENSAEIGHVTVTWELGDFSLKSISGYVGFERAAIMSAPEIERFVVYLNSGADSDAWSQEFNFSGDLFDGAVNFLLGAYYTVDDGSTPYGARINLDEVAGLATPSGQVLVFPPTSETKDVSSAVFLDGYWSMLDNLRLVFGVRASEEHRELTQTFQPYVEDTQSGTSVVTDLTSLFLGTNITPIQTCNHEHHEIDFSSVDPKLGVEWDVLDDTLLYLQYQTGFKAGGFDTSTGCNETYDPEQITAYELGVKSTMFGGALTVNAAAFTYDYQDYQVDKVVGFEAVIENAAAATTNGFELEATFTPLTWLAFDAQYSYLDATYDEYIGVDNFRNTQVAAGDAPEEDLSGNRLSRSPENTLNVGATFFANINKFGIGMATLRAEAYYSDEVYFREFNRDIEKQDSYNTYNAFLSVTSLNEKITFTLYGKNLSDETYQVGQIPFDTVKYRGAYYAPPRTFGGSISVGF